MAFFDGSHALVNRGDLGILLCFGEGMVEVSGVALIGEAAEEGGGIGGGHSLLKKRRETNPEKREWKATGCALFRTIVLPIEDVSREADDFQRGRPEAYAVI
jgi:hypothetical protein